MPCKALTGATGLPKRIAKVIRHSLDLSKRKPEVMLVIGLAGIWNKKVNTNGKQAFQFAFHVLVHFSKVFQGHTFSV